MESMVNGLINAQKKTKKKKPRNTPFSFNGLINARRGELEIRDFQHSSFGALDVRCERELLHLKSSN